LLAGKHLIAYLPPRRRKTGSMSDAVGRRWLETTDRGRHVLEDPKVNRGVAFTPEERAALGLTGLLPPQVLTLDQQAERAYSQFSRQPSPLAKHVFLGLLQDRNEVLFFRLIADHLREMLPVVYTPTVGDAISQYSHEYRGPRGVYLSVDAPDAVDAAFEATGLGPDDVDLIVATDGEAILGIGDWGVGGIGIAVGKLAVYTAAAGIDPMRVLPVVLDVGTNRESLLEDPLYLGNRHRRVPEGAYDAFIDAYVESATRHFGHALLHWEDLGAANARRVLLRYRDRILTFNDDIQGTGAVNLATVLSALRVTGGLLSEQVFVVYGAGTAGVGIADQLRDALVSGGLEEEAARARFFLLGSKGLLLASQSDRLRDFQRPYARRDAEVEAWERTGAGEVGLAEVVRRVKPTVLIGTSGQPGAFDEEVVRAMAEACERPVILPLSNPTSLSEAEPADLLEWTSGRALVATGSPFEPVTYDKTVHVIAQANNAFVFPGLGLGAIVARASRVTDSMLHAAAAAIADQVDPTTAGAPLLPQVEALRTTSAAVAKAVAEAAVADGVADPSTPAGPALAEAIAAAMWEPVYRPIRAV
jgi:malate dehydrogenase (oxaloacetate-decarboxylating)